MAWAISGSGQDWAVFQPTPCVGGVGAHHRTFVFCLSPSVGSTTCTHCVGMALRGLKETNKQVRVFSFFSSHKLRSAAPRFPHMCLGLIVPLLVSVELREDME